MISGLGGSYGSASLAEMSQNFFKKADSNADGGISLDEFKTAAPPAPPAGGPPPGGGPGGAKGAPDAEKLFSEIDADSDGSISEEENETFLEKMLANQASNPLLVAQEAPDASEIFAKLDADGDGSVSEEEFVAGAPQDAPPGAPDPSELFAMIDSDGDGAISEAENETALAQRQQTQAIEEQIRSAIASYRASAASASGTQGGVALVA